MRADWIWCGRRWIAAAGAPAPRLRRRARHARAETCATSKMGLIAYESSSFTRATAACRGEPARRRALLRLARRFKGAMRSSTRSPHGVGIARARTTRPATSRAPIMLDRPIPRYQRVRDSSPHARKIEAGRLLCWRAAYLADLSSERTSSSKRSGMAQEHGPRGRDLGDAGRHPRRLRREALPRREGVESSGHGQIQRIVIARRLVAAAVKLRPGAGAKRRKKHGNGRCRTARFRRRHPRCLAARCHRRY